jgi:LysM repeat protein
MVARFYVYLKGVPMSVATDLVPVVYIPARARRPEPVGATVVALHRPSVRSVAAPVRLTRRGVGVLAAAVAAVAGALFWLAWLSAPASASLSAGSPAGSPAPISVQVHSGDTLWSIALRVAPHTDPRAEVAALQRLNHLSGADLAAGQVLRTR